MMILPGNSRSRKRKHRSTIDSSTFSMQESSPKGQYQGRRFFIRQAADWAADLAMADRVRIDIVPWYYRRPDMGQAFFFSMTSNSVYSELTIK